MLMYMEWCEQGDLAWHISERKNQGGRFPERRVASWFAEMASALSYMHARRVLHRDVRARAVARLRAPRVQPVLREAHLGPLRDHAAIERARRRQRVVQQLAAAVAVLVCVFCVCLYVTLVTSVFGWPVCQPGWSEPIFSCSVTFHRLYVMCGRVLACPETSLGRVRLHEDQADLWRNKLVHETATRLREGARVRPASRPLERGTAVGRCEYVRQKMVSRDAWHRS